MMWRDSVFFVGAEQLANEDVDGKAITNELWKELERFGVQRSSEVFEGYDVLLNHKHAEESE